MPHASSKPTHRPSGTIASAATKQNAAKLHIPVRKPRRNRTALAAPSRACVNASSTVSATGNGVNTPLRAGPSRSASSVTVSTSAIAESIRSGRSQAECRAAGAPGAALRSAAIGSGAIRSGRSRGTATKLAHEMASPATAPGCHACAQRVSAVKAAQLAGRLAHHGARIALHA